MLRSPSRAAIVASAVVATSCAAIVGLDDPAAIEGSPDAALIDGTTGAGTDGGDDGGGVTDAPSTNDGNGPDANVDGGSCNEPDLVARWRLQEGSGTRVFDCTSGAHHGDFAGGPAWVNGRAGRKAVSFDGTTGMQIDMGNAPDLRLTGAMTVAVWVYVRTASNDGRFLSKGGDVGDRGWDVKMEAANGSLELRIANDASVQTSLFAANFPLNAWKHVAAVYAPTVGRLYVDGQKVSELTGTFPAAQHNSTANVLLGARTGGFTLDGMLDDARIYKRALTDAEVTALFTAN